VSSQLRQFLLPPAYAASATRLSTASPTENWAGNFSGHALYGAYQPYPADRVRSLHGKSLPRLVRQFPDSSLRPMPPGASEPPSYVSHRHVRGRTGGNETYIALNSPIAPNVPTDVELRRLMATGAPVRLR